MKYGRSVFDFLFREWLLSAVFVGLAATSLYLKKSPRLTGSEIEVLFLLWLLLVSVKGLQTSGLVARWSSRIGSGRLLPLKLVAATFLLSMLVTNDVALVVLVPLTLSLDSVRKDLLVILEAFAANAGSALTPFGNPQNLYIYWFYHIDPWAFFTAIAPFSAFFLLILAPAALWMGNRGGGLRERREEVARSAYVHVGMTALVAAVILRLAPLAAGALVPAYAALFDRKSLRVDYLLLATFLCLFGLSENVRVLLGSRLEHAGHVFLLSALSSQLISNVPAAVLLAKQTVHWKALLWGTNTGGFGSLVASLANLIAYRFYVSRNRERKDVMSFTIKFVGLGLVMLSAGMGLYWVIGR